MRFSQQTKPSSDQTNSQEQKQDDREQEESSQESERKAKESQEDWDEDYKEKTNEFKWYRKLAFVIGKTMKYTMWAGIGLYFYHLYLVNYNEKPETGFLANDRFLYSAMWTRVAVQDLRELLTMPPVKALLGERYVPPGYQTNKSLILSVNGVLVHSEYKVRSFSFVTTLALVWNWL